MMAKRLSRKELRMDASEWLYPWRLSNGSSFHKWVAVLLVTGLFAIFLTSVRIQVAMPTRWASSAGSVIHVGNDPVGLALKMRAREGGPFLARFDPAAWADIAALETAAFDEAFGVRAHYEPSLRELPDDRVVTPASLATKGEPVFPKRPGSPRTAMAETLKISPILYPLSGISFDALPDELPPFDVVVDSTMTADPWRFLVRIGPLGAVRECISITGGDEAEAERAALLEDWLRGVTFNPEPGKPARWIAVGIGFTNQPADGSEPR